MREKAPLDTILPGFLILALAISPNVAAQMRMAVSRPMPAPTFAGLQNLLASPAGVSLLAANSQLNPLQQVVSMNPSAPGTLQVLGPLAATLPADFSARVEAAQTSGSVAPLAEILAKAYAASVPTALAEIDARASAAVKSAASDANAWRSLGSAASDLKSYSLYGEAARERVTLFAQKAATVRSQELAENLSREFLAGLRGPESAAEDIPAGPVNEKSFARQHARLARAAPGLAPDRMIVPPVSLLNRAEGAPVPALAPALAPALSAPALMGAKMSVHTWLEPAAEFSKSVRMTPDGLQVLMKNGGLQEYRFSPELNRWDQVGVVSPWMVAWRKGKDRLAKAVGLKSQPRPLAELADKQELHDFDINSGAGTYRWNQAEKLWYAVYSQRSGPGRSR